jgi:hypothetical protein
MKYSKRNIEIHARGYFSFSGNKIKQAVFLLTPENLCVLRVLCGDKVFVFVV